MTKFNPSLHGLRGIAALAVLLFHWALTFPALRETAVKTSGALGSAFNALVSFGWVGVLLFFALSGFLLTKSNASINCTRAQLSAFWLRRFLRIYPAVWVQLIILSLLLWVLTTLKHPQGILEWVLNFTLLINLPPYLPYPINAVWWTLPIELCFYLLFPVLILVSNRTSIWTLFVVALSISLGWRIGCMYYFRELPSYGPVQPYIDLLPGCLVIFVMGMLAAKCQLTISEYQRRIAIGLMLITIALLFKWLLSNITTYWTGHWMLAIWNILVSACLAAIIWLVTLDTTNRSWLASKPLVFLGEISFGVYLWHYPVLLVFYQWLPPAEHTSALISALVLIGIIIPTIILASISHYLIERPAMQLGKRLSRSLMS